MDCFITKQTASSKTSCEPTDWYTICSSTASRCSSALVPAASDSSTITTFIHMSTLRSRSSTTGTSSGGRGCSGCNGIRPVNETSSRGEKVWKRRDFSRWK